MHPHPAADRQRSLGWVVDQLATIDRTISALVSGGCAQHLIDDQCRVRDEYLGRLDHAYAALRRSLTGV